MIAVDPVIVTCAVRYALGRSSYMPGLVADEVRSNWADLGDQRDVIRRDIVDYIASVPDSSWDRHVIAETWRPLLTWIDAQEVES